MPTDDSSAHREYAPAPPGALPPGRAWRLAPFLLLFPLALPDLLAPPISPTILRQTQTFAQTVNFVAAGFSPAGLTIDINGPVPFRVVYEFPLYQALVGALFTVFGPSFLAGKAVSLLATLGALALFQRLVRAHAGEAVALRAALLFAACPITLLLATAFQPDALALALALLSVASLARWRAAPSSARWLAFLAALLGAALAKFTLLVPLAPLLAAGLLRRDGRWRAPRFMEIVAALIVVVAPFVAWNLHRAQLMDPAYLAVDRRDFLLGDLGRFVHAGYYAKPAFILGAMVCCGAGLVFLAAGLRRPGAVERLLLAGVPLYFILLPTASEQTYYAVALVPALALLMARGLVALEAAAAPAWAGRARTACILAWAAGFAVAAPYTLRRDHVTLAAAHAVWTSSQPGDLLFVLNMHDRGVGIGAFNPAIVTLARRRGWNVDFTSADPAALRAQIERRRAAGARWIVATWFTPDLDPWFTPLWPRTFSRQPRLHDTPVDGHAITADLARDYPVAARGANYAVLRIP